MTTDDTNGRPTQRGNRPLEESRINRGGLPAGTITPGFRLPQLDGEELALDVYRGHRVLLVFSSPACEPCNELAPLLEMRHRTSPDVRIVMISMGGVEENRAKAREHGLSFPVVLQQGLEVSRAYGLFAWPVAYLVDERGVIAADVAWGAPAILDLVDDNVAAPEAEGPSLRE